MHSIYVYTSFIFNLDTDCKREREGWREIEKGGGGGGGRGR